MVDLPLPITTEILLGGEWVDISSDVRAEEAVRITRGRADEAGTADPSKLKLRLNNRHGRYSPRNPLSPYYGQLRRNTPLRVRLGSIPESAPAVLSDTFARTVSGGWGDADTGQTWSIDSGASPDFSVSNGAGRIELDTVDVNRTMVSDAGLSGDLDITSAVSVSDLVQGELAAAAFARIILRFADHTIVAIVGFRVRTGTSAFDGPVSAAIGVAPDQFTATELVPELAYFPDAIIRVRVQVVGPQVRMRLWADGEDEPGTWHAQVHTGTDNSGSCIIGARARTTPDAELPEPLEVRFHELEVRPYTPPPPVVRFTGEVSAWPPRWDVSDSDVWVPITAAGIKRRLGQGRSAAISMARAMHTVRRPPAYWPMEDGADTRRATSAVPGGQPLLVRGLLFGEDDSLPVSGPLPVLSPSAFMISSPVPMADTGAWTIGMFIYLSADDAPDEDGQEERMLRFTVSGGTIAEVNWNLVFGSGFGYAHRVTAFDDGGAELSEHFYTIDNSLFLDKWSFIQVQARQDGGNVEWMAVHGNFETNVRRVSNLSFSGTPGRLSQINTRWGSGLEGMAVGHVAAWGGWEPVVTGAIRVRMIGGEEVGQRLARLAAAAEVPLLLQGTGATAMGAQPTLPFLDLLHECEETGLGALTEQRGELGLRYRGRDTLYNQTPALVLDYQDGEITPPVEPTDDDQAVRNDVTAKRARGAEVREVAEDGPMGVVAIGRYDESTTINVASDQQLPSQASWRLHLGTVDEARVPTLHLNLANPRMRSHHDAVMALDTGDRVRVLNPPSWVQTGHLDLIVQGYEESISLYRWDVTLTCTPASPWDVWTISDADPAALVDAPQDDFERAESSTWGTSSSGHPWTSTGGNGFDRNVDGSAGTITIFSSPATVRFQRIGSADITDSDVTIAVSVDQTPTDGSFYPGVLLRFIGGLDYYRARLRLRPDSIVDIEILRTTNLVELAAAVATFGPGDVLWFRARLVGQELRAKIWLDGDPEPSDWTVTADMSALAPLDSGEIGTVASASSGISNSSPVLSFHSFNTVEATVPEQRERLDTSGSELALAAGADDTELLVATDSPYQVWITTATRPQGFPLRLQLGGEVVEVTGITGEYSPQAMTVVRSVNGISKSHPAGTRLRLAREGVVS